MFEMGRTEIKLMFTKTSIYHSGEYHKHYICSNSCLHIFNSTNTQQKKTLTFRISIADESQQTVSVSQLQVNK